MLSITTLNCQLNTLPTNLVQYYEDNGFIYFKPNMLDEQKLFIDYKDVFFEKFQDDMILKKTWVDKQLNLKHNRYQQTYAGVEVEGCEFTEHLDPTGSFVVAANGKICSEIFKRQPEGWMSEENALNYLLDYLDGDMFSWYYSEWEKQAQIDADDSTATTYPSGKKLFALNTFDNIQFDIPEEDYTPTWRFVVRSVSPYYYKEFFVDALNGDIFRENSLMMHDGPANISNYGTQTIDTRWFGFLTQAHILHSDNNGRNFRTRYYGTDLWWLQTDVTSVNDIWGSSNVKATDVHWAIQKSFDYFKTKFQRNGMRDDNTILRLSVSQTNGQADLEEPTAYLVPGASANFDYIQIRYEDNVFAGTLDICAHEFTHGITHHSSNLGITYEQGALNESFSDIFGVVIRNSISNSNDWTQGQNVLTNFRKLDNPKSGGVHYDIVNNLCEESVGQPDTYLGQYWETTGCDYGGVHVNCGVQNHWFYILSQGKSGMNDNGDSYNVTGIGIDDATSITYYNITNFIQNLSTFIDSKSGATLSAILLYGQCSDQAIQTNQAWHAVGLADISSCEELAIQENAKIEIKLYPNPTTNNLHITSVDNINNVYLYNINGEKVNLDIEGDNIDISNLSKGVYLVKIVNKNNITINKKFIKI